MSVQLLEDKKIEPYRYENVYDNIRATGCCNQNCSLKSFAFWLVAGKAYRK